AANVSGFARSERFVTTLARTDADHLVHGQDEDLAVADPAGLGGLLYGLDDLRDLVVGNDDLELYLGEKIDHVLGSSIELGVALLAAETLHLGDRETLCTDRAQALLHLVELEWFDDRLDLLHDFPPEGAAPSYQSACRRETWRARPSLSG